MSDALASGLSASLAIAFRYAPPPMPVPPRAPELGQPINLNAPVYVSPAISFDPVTNIVFITFRNAESGKVTDQVPPSQVLSRYRFIDETGMPDPTLPDATPYPFIGVGPAIPTPPPAPTVGSAPPTGGSGKFA